MANVTFNANDTDGASEFEVGYRVYGSGAAFTLIVPNPVTLPVTKNDLPNNRYESQIRKKCASTGLWADYAYGVSAGCPAPFSFTVVQNGKNFVITYTLAAGQTKFNLETTDPNGGKSNLYRTDGNSATITIPMNPVIPGEFGFRLQGICDETAVPVYASDFTNTVFVQVADTSLCGQVTDTTVTGITATTATISGTIPADASNVSGYLLLYADVADQVQKTMNAAAPVFNVTGLVSGHTYAYYIQTNCGASMSSAPVYGGTFNTL